MASSSKPPPPPPSNPALPPQSATVNPPESATFQTENPSTAPNAGHSLSPPPEEHALSKSSHLTRKELLRRRLRHVRKLSKVYRDYFWALMEEVRVQYREYYWQFGVSPYKDDDERDIRELTMAMSMEGTGETNTNNNCGGFHGGGYANGGVGGSGGKLGFGEGSGGGSESKPGGKNRCTFVGCKLKAMALTNFCHLHILSDPNQKLYKACNFVIKSAQAGPILCGKPILRSTVPSLCTAHFQKAQKHVTRALKKAGLNSNSSKVAPKFHAIVAECVHQIQAKRRESHKPSGTIVIKEECGS